jgi:hypothetical protein
MRTERLCNRTERGVSVCLILLAIAAVAAYIPFRHARNTNHTANVFQSQGEEEDDHLPFLKRGVPSLDVIDADYGAHTSAMPTATTIPTRTLSTR